MVPQKLKKSIVSLITVIAFCAFGTTAKSQQNPFGLVFSTVGNNQQLNISTKIKVAHSLNVSYIRMHVFMSDWNGTIPDYDAFSKAGFKILLNVNFAKSSPGNSAPFATDLTAYKKTLSEILDKYRPEVVVVENEENNRQFHSGTSQEYLNELKAAIEVAHAKGLKVANGGLILKTVPIVVYQDYLARGMRAQGEDFANRAIPDATMMDIKSGRMKSDFLAQIQLTKELIEGYKNLDLDYVNFHWYEPAKFRAGESLAKRAAAVQKITSVDTKAITEVVQYLQRATGKTVINNEFGEINPSPQIVTDLLTVFLQLHVPYVIWYNGDGGGMAKAFALNGVDGTLRDNGKAFSNFTNSHFAAH